MADNLVQVQKDVRFWQRLLTFAGYAPGRGLFHPAQRAVFTVRPTGRTYINSLNISHKKSRYPVTDSDPCFSINEE